MGERKVLNKYIPADFDPRLVPRSKKPKDNLVPVRMMLPFSIQCSTCSSFMYRGRKFNSKKEPVSGPNGKYLSIQRYRFYIKCTVCSRPITFLTDPKNADYEMESGATRNYEIWHDKEKTEEEIAEEVDLEESVDPLKALENRVLDSQREMADLDNLDEIKAMNMRHVQMMRAGAGLGSVAAVLNSKNDGAAVALNEDGLTQEEEDMIQSIQFAKQQNKNNTSVIKRLGQEDEEMLELKRKREEEILQQHLLKQKTKDADKPFIPVISVKRKRIEPPKKQPDKNDDSKDKTSSKSPEKSNDSSDNNGGLSGLLGAYDSSSAEDDE